MFSAVAHKNLTDAEGYFDEHLSQNDYYAAGEIRPGQWIGVGAERLGGSAALCCGAGRAPAATPGGAGGGARGDSPCGTLRTLGGVSGDSRGGAWVGADATAAGGVGAGVGAGVAAAGVDGIGTGLDAAGLGASVGGTGW